MGPLFAKPQGKIGGVIAVALAMTAIFKINSLKR